MFSVLRFILLSFIVLDCALAQSPGEPNVNLTTLQISDERGNRSVSYFVDRGYAIVDGDVVYGTVEELLAHAVDQQIIINVNRTNITKRRLSGNSRRSTSIFPGTSGWPGGLVKYQYEDSSVEAQFSSAVEGAITRWKAAVSCLQFQKLPTGTSGPGIVIRAGGSGACWAPIGGPGTILLANGCGVNELTHEFGHVLGLIHEQQRYDRDLNTQFFCKNLRDYPYDPIQKDSNTGLPLHLPAYYGGGTFGGDSCCGEDYPGVCCGWACQFNRRARAYTYTDQPPSNGLNGGAYDLKSIMHYRTSAFAKAGKLTLSKGPVSNPTDISDGDAARVRELYGCPGPNPPSCPKGCNPVSGLNLCQWPSAQTCVFPTMSAKTPYCACAAGFKSKYPDDDTEHHWRVNDPGQIDRVWVAEGVACDVLCKQPFGTGSCREVKLLPDTCIKG